MEKIEKLSLMSNLDYINSIIRRNVEFNEKIESIFKDVLNNPDEYLSNIGERDNIKLNKLSKKFIDIFKLITFSNPQITGIESLDELLMVTKTSLLNGNDEKVFRVNSYRIFISLETRFNSIFIFLLRIKIGIFLSRLDLDKLDIPVVSNKAEKIFPSGFELTLKKVIIGDSMELLESMEKSKLIKEIIFYEDPFKKISEIVRNDQKIENFDHQVKHFFKNVGSFLKKRESSETTSFYKSKRNWLLFETENDTNNVDYWSEERLAEEKISLIDAIDVEWYRSVRYLRKVMEDSSSLLFFSYIIGNNEIVEENAKIVYNFKLISENDIVQLDSFSFSWSHLIYLIKNENENNIKNKLQMAKLSSLSYMSNDELERKVEKNKRTLERYKLCFSAPYGSICDLSENIPYNLEYSENKEELWKIY